MKASASQAVSRLRRASSFDRSSEVPGDALRISSNSYLTPTELFYIRSHFPTPTLDVANYQLRIDGAVRAPWKELQGIAGDAVRDADRHIGSGRVMFASSSSHRFEERNGSWASVGNGGWTGVPLRALLERAGLEDDACDVRACEGADRGIPTEEPVPPGRSPMPQRTPEKAVQPEV